LHTWDGARVAAQAIAHGTAKDRKIMLKSMKGYVTKACNEEYGQLVILRILDLLDDTTLVNKLILSVRFINYVILTCRLW
jgi:pumilio family protein 6